MPLRGERNLPLESRILILVIDEHLQIGAHCGLARGIEQQRPVVEPKSLTNHRPTEVERFVDYLESSLGRNQLRKPRRTAARDRAYEHVMRLALPMSSGQMSEPVA